jgi:hypothetical protein
VSAGLTDSPSGAITEARAIDMLSEADSVQKISGPPAARGTGPLSLSLSPLSRGEGKQLQRSDHSKQYRASDVIEFSRGRESEEDLSRASIRGRGATGRRRG